VPSSGLGGGRYEKGKERKTPSRTLIQEKVGEGKWIPITMIQGENRETGGRGQKEG